MAEICVAMVVNVVPSSAWTSNSTSGVQGTNSTSVAFGLPTVVGVNVTLAGTGAVNCLRPARTHDTPVTTPTSLPLSAAAPTATVPSETVDRTSPMPIAVP